MPAVFFVMTVSVLTCATMRGHVMAHASDWKLLDSPNPKGLDSPTKVYSPERKRFDLPNRVYSPLAETSRPAKQKRFSSLRRQEQCEAQD